MAIVVHKVVEKLFGRKSSRSPRSCSSENSEPRLRQETTQMDLSVEAPEMIRNISFYGSEGESIHSRLGNLADLGGTY